MAKNTVGVINSNVIMRSRASTDPEPRDKVSPSRVKQAISPRAIPAHRNLRNRSKGLHTWKRTMSPTMARMAAQTVAVWSPFRPNTARKAWHTSTTNTLVSPPGKALRRTPLRKCPRIRSYLGSRVSRNEGRPMVRAEMMVR